MAQQQLVFQLYHLYDNREAAAIADWVMEHITGWKKIDRIVNKKVPLSLQQEALLEQYTASLLAHKPVQYVLHEAWFYGMKLYVDEHVLIPRPETEELAEWIISDIRQIYPPSSALALSLLDIGTGSGCIAIALKQQLPFIHMRACDTSGGALQVAQKNAREQQTDISFHQLNFLDPAARGNLPSFQVIVSNPPYIPLRDKGSMKENVVAHEPSMALFVPDDDPLVFYHAIADFAQEHLLPGGHIYTEINEELAEGVTSLFSCAGFTEVTLRTDMQQKPRMVKATRLQ